MVDRLMVVNHAKEAILSGFIAHDERAGLEPALQVRPEGKGCAVVDDPQKNIAPALDDPKDDGFVRGEATPAFAAQERVVNLDDLARLLWRAANLTVTVHIAHVAAHFAAHAPRGFVGHADLALDFLGRHAIPRSAE